MTPRDYAHDDEIAASVRGPDATDKLHWMVMIAIGVAVAILSAGTFIGFIVAGE